MDNDISSRALKLLLDLQTQPFFPVTAELYRPHSWIIETVSGTLRPLLAKTVCALHQPPPPPPPPPCGKQPLGIPPPPCPQHAAVPFLCDARLPVQETGDPSDGSHDLQNVTAPLQPEDHNTPPSPPLHGQEDTESDDGNKQHPVQETDPAPQAYENPQLSETTDHDGVSGMDEDDDI